VSLAGELEVRFDACLSAARDYFETRGFRAGSNSVAAPPNGN
jgi:hypothetical protein